MMIFEIKHRWTGAVLYSCEANNIKEAVVHAVGKKADLRWANLSSADLRWANLSSANLSWANLSSANLSSANLSSADLRSADLRSADLSSADLRWANLRSADLSSANLSSADLRWANLREGVKIKAGRAVLIFAGGGSVGRDVLAFDCETGIYVQAGCFVGDLNEFRAKVLQDENGDKTTKKSMQYLGFANIAAISFDKPNEVQS